MFEKTVIDLIKEIRSKKFTIQQTLSDIQSEIVKAETRVRTGTSAGNNFADHLDPSERFKIS